MTQILFCCSQIIFAVSSALRLKLVIVHVQHAVISALVLRRVGVLATAMTTFSCSKAISRAAITFALFISLGSTDCLWGVTPVCGSALWGVSCMMMAAGHHRETPALGIANYINE